MREFTANLMSAFMITAT